MKKKVAQDFVEPKNLLPLNLQFFAEKNEEDGEDDSKGESDDNDDSDDEDQNNPGEKTFTQSQVNRMMSKEKKEGKSSMLKALGFKSEAEAKKAVAMLNAFKSDEEKEQIEKDELTKSKSEAEKRAQAAENKLACLTAGVSKDSLEDVLAIALLKVTDEKDLDTVLAEMKKQAKYSSFFGNIEDEDGKKKKEDKGTGSDPGHSAGKGGKDSKENYGARLAKSAGAKKKNSYFK